MSVRTLVRRSWSSLRYRLGLRIASPPLEAGDDESVAGFYRSRVTHCHFLGDPAHYEHPRAAWILSHATGGDLLEVGCGDGGMTLLLAPRVSQLLAVDVSSPSLAAVRALGLPNVQTAEALVEDFVPGRAFDRVVLSEVLEHLRRPERVLERCFGWLNPGGRLLVTTPNGHWESDEHLQEFNFSRFGDLFTRLGAEEVTIAYLRDAAGRRRWLTASVVAPSTAPTPDDFFDRRAVAAARARRRVSAQSHD